jgi:hypothetical protein
MELDSAGPTHGGNGFPVQFASASTVDLTIATGAVKPNQEFTMQFLYDNAVSKMLINNQENAMPPNPLLGHKVYAAYGPNGEVKIDSISGLSASDTQRQAFVAIMAAVQKNMQFPERKLMVGDTFSKYTSIKLPISQLKVSYGINALYKLVKVEGKEAFFNIDLVVKQDFEGEQNEITMNAGGDGAGSGTLIYNIDENYCEKVSAEYNFR